MDQFKTGSFLKELRKEKGITQEQLAEKFNVSGRTVSRWENGNNMPDISVLVEISEFYNVDIREIIDGERKSENMNENIRETLAKVADYTNSNKEVKKRKLNMYFTIGLLCIVFVIIDNSFSIFSYIFKGNIPEFMNGALCGLGLIFEFTGFYNNNHDTTLKQRKIHLLNRLR